MKKIFLLLVGLICLNFCNKDYKFSSNLVKNNVVMSGVRSSAYGIRPFPHPVIWENGIKIVNEHYDGNSIPSALWIVGVMGRESKYCRLEFPVDTSKYVNIECLQYDKHEKYLSHFDSTGVKVFLQVEPAMANVDTLIKLVLDRYSHHPCVVGFGVDAEWHQYTEREDWGVPIKDSEAERWEIIVKNYNSDYQLFVKHWDRNWMPKTYRGDIIFVSDSQMFRNRKHMITEFTEYWGPYFHPNTVFYQIGYPADKDLWNSLNDPIKEWGITLANGHQQDIGIFWVDFSMRDAIDAFKKTGPYIIGTKIYGHNGEMEGLFDELKTARINTLVASGKLNSNEEFRRLAEKNAMKRFLIFPTFYAPEYLNNHPDHYAIQKNGEIAKKEWVEFVCPSRDDFRQMRIDQLRQMVEEYNPDGISIDFIRHFAFWEKIYPERTMESLPNTCFCEHCMTAFQKHINRTIPAKTPSQYYQWIMDNQQEEWVQWKSSLITNMVRDLVAAAREIQPGILVNIHVVPWRKEDFGNAREIVLGQDISQLAKYADYLSPMTYAHMVKQEPEWIAEVVREMAAETDCNILPSFQVANTYRDDEISNDTFRQYLNNASRYPSSGFVCWSWERLTDEEKKILIK